MFHFFCSNVPLADYQAVTKSHFSAVFTKREPPKIGGPLSTTVLKLLHFNSFLALSRSLVGRRLSPARSTFPLAIPFLQTPLGRAQNHTLCLAMALRIKLIDIKSNLLNKASIF